MVLRRDTKSCKVKPIVRCFPNHNWSLCDSDNSFYINRLRGSKKPCAAESVALLENPALSTDDRQALETIISRWAGLDTETKTRVMQVIEGAPQKVKPS